MIRIEIYIETACNGFKHKYSSYSITSWCNSLDDIEENVLSLCEMYKFDLKDIKKIFIFIEGEIENEKN